MLANFHMCGIILLRVVLNMLMRNASARVTMCFRCLPFILSGPWEWLFYCLLDLSCGECNVISLFVLSVACCLLSLCCFFV